MWRLNITKLIVPGLFLILFQIISCSSDPYGEWYEKLKVDFDGDAKIEVGGPYVGVEFHHSSCTPQRISFFYPAANSIDLSTDYWYRDTTFIMALGLKIGEDEKEWLGKTPLTFSLTPYNVTFKREDSQKEIEISYQFTKNYPAMVVTYRITNRSDKEQKIQFDTHLATSLRTSHTFKPVNQSWTQYDPESSTIFVNHPDPETQKVQLFVSNIAEMPEQYDTKGPLNAYLRMENDQWAKEPRIVPEASPGETTARFLYQADLAHGEAMEVVQIIGTAKAGEGISIVRKLRTNLKEDLNIYENSILTDIFTDEIINTGDQDLDHSVSWAKAILASNQHYLDGEIVPMPCPAEYNFYFTHDVLVTDLAAVNFDPVRVKRDLDFIIRHANKDHIIPHAYYWKDSTYVTEYADKDNWNNFWMIIASASYLRHSADSSYVRQLFPYLSKCLQTALLNKETDNLMWSNRPDWWDIGRNYGPRSYMTILAIKAIRDYVYVGMILQYEERELIRLGELADAMQNSLTEHLWDEDMEYLVNFHQDKSLDKHYYIGSLLAAHYGNITTQKCSLLVNSASNNLLDPEVGIYNAYPMDFHDLIDYLKFTGNEAGAVGFYMNGGIWPQGNAWYALAQIADGSRDESYRFVKQNMTLAGIMAGPNGQPAMYEVRNSNQANPKVYGTVDKPQFLWAGAWYLYTLYHLFAITEDNWNITFSPYLHGDHKSFNCRIYAHGHNLNLHVEGTGTDVKQIRFDGIPYPSLVIPLEIGSVKDVQIDLGIPVLPYLKYTNSTLLNSTYEMQKKKIILNLKAYVGHKNKTVIVSPFELKSIWCDGRKLNSGLSETKNGSFWEYAFESDHLSTEKAVEVEFL